MTQVHLFSSDEEKSENDGWCLTIWLWPRKHISFSETYFRMFDLALLL